MDFLKKLGKALLFPHVAIIIMLVPLAAALLVYSFVVLGEEHPLSYVCYMVAMYTLTVVCFRIPNMISFFKRIKNENKYVVLLSGDVRLRTNLSLAGSTAWDFAYATFQLGLGFYHQSTWYFSLAFYYTVLALMRTMLFTHLKKSTPGEELEREYKRYRFCGIMLIIMNLALLVMVLYIVWRIRIFEHHEITTIAMAAYTFTTFTFAIINLIKYRKYQSPAFSASKSISLAAAFVSMLTLENAMLTAFGAGEGEQFHRIMTGLTGVGVIGLVMAIGIGMIIKANRNLKKVRSAQENAYGQQ